MNTVLPYGAAARASRPDDASRTDRFLRLIDRLHDAYLAEYDEDLNRVLGAPAGPEGVAGSRRAPGLMRRRLESPARDLVNPAELPHLAERLDRLLGQLVNMARAAAGRCSSPEFGAALNHADRLRTGPAAAASADAVQVRRMAMAAQDLLDQLEPDVATEPLPTFEPHLRDRELWCA
ncbi:DUF6415 family natural product biosynthesis protein [Streptomyces sp. NPDC014733]|uniref:DUF6415 family natural product biosynthesis protein n=1 Tax=Streptomyces sp. NPDC014733 TaxID=3364885 RepID=UPI0036FEA355